MVRARFVIVEQIFNAIDFFKTSMKSFGAFYLLLTTWYSDPNRKNQIRHTVSRVIGARIASSMVIWLFIFFLVYKMSSAPWTGFAAIAPRGLV